MADDLNVKTIDCDDLFEIVASLDNDVLDRYIGATVDSEPNTTTVAADQDHEDGTKLGKWPKRIKYSLTVLSVGFLLLFLSSYLLSQEILQEAVNIALVLSFVGLTTGYVSLILFVYYDTKHVSRHHRWNANTVAWTLGVASLHVFVGLYYLYVRRSKF